VVFLSLDCLGVSSVAWAFVAWWPVSFLRVLIFFLLLENGYACLWCFISFGGLFGSLSLSFFGVRFGSLFLRWNLFSWHIIYAESSFFYWFLLQLRNILNASKDIHLNFIYKNFSETTHSVDGEEPPSKYWDPLILVENIFKMIFFFMVGEDNVGRESQESSISLPFPIKDFYVID